MRGRRLKPGEGMVVLVHLYIAIKGFGIECVKEYNMCRKSLKNNSSGTLKQDFLIVKRKICFCQSYCIYSQSRICSLIFMH